MHTDSKLAREYDMAHVEVMVQLRVLHHYAQQAVNIGAVDEQLAQAVQKVSDAEARLEDLRMQIVGTVEA